MVALQLEAAGLKRLTTEDKQRGKPAQYVDQSSALGSLLVEREDMQQVYGIKNRPNSSKNPGVLHAKTLRTSRQSSLTSKSGRSNSRTSVRSTSRASQRSARSQASVVSKASGRARSTVGSRRGSSNVPQKKRTGKGKGRVGQQQRTFFLLHRPDPEASTCAGFGHSFCWVRHARKSACSYVLV